MNREWRTFVGERVYAEPIVHTWSGQSKFNIFGSLHIDRARLLIFLMTRIRSFRLRLSSAQRTLRLICALLVLIFHGCGKEQTATPEEQIREAWRLYRLSEFSEALGIFESVEASQPRGSESLSSEPLRAGLVLESPA